LIGQKLINYMGEWTNVEGTHNSKRVSMKKLVKLAINDDELVFGSQENGQDFCFHFSGSGDVAAKKLQLVATEFKRLDKNARLHMRAEIDFYA
jgi:hypothetical protein